MGSTRREMLRALLGAPAALAACRPADRGFDASWVDPSFDRGHLLRDGPPRVGAPVERRARVVIVGAGVAGLAAGWSLRRRGVPGVVVLELEAGPGGTAMGGRGPVGGFPWGAHYLPAPRADQPELVELLETMGIVAGRTPDGEPLYAEGARVATPAERIHADGIWRSGLLPGLAPGGGSAVRRLTARMQALARARGDDGLPAFALPTSRSSEDPRFLALDRLSFAEWLEREGFRHPDVRWLADYACRDDYGARPDRTSAWFGVHYHAARLGPAGTSAPFLTWPEGNQRLVDALARGLEIHPDRLVTRIRPHASGHGVEVLALGPGGAERWVAERAVVAVPGFLRRRIVEGVPALPDPGLETSAWLVANLHLRTRPGYDGFETAWDNVLRDSRSLGYVVSTHQLGPPTGPTTWTWYLPLVDVEPPAGRRALLGLDLREAAELALADLAPAHRGLRSAVEKVELRRWGHAMPIPGPGTRSSRALRAARTPRGPIHFAHADLSGVALFEEAFDHGTRAAREVAGALGAASTGTRGESG